MRINGDGIGYSWEELRPIHRLVKVMYAMQVLGALAGLLVAQGDWMPALWRGAALATFPGFVVGAIYQWASDSLPLRGNGIMVAFVGMLALFFTFLGAFFAAPD